MGKYGEALGFWEHGIGEIEHRLKPKKVDNLTFARIISSNKKDDMGWVLEQVAEIYKGMVLRENPQFSEEDKKELDEWVGLNAVQIWKDMLVAFRWITKDKLEDMEKKEFEDQKKKITQT